MATLKETLLGGAVNIFGVWTRAQEQTQWATIANNFGSAGRIDVSFTNMNGTFGDGVSSLGHITDMKNAGLTRFVLIATPTLPYQSHSGVNITAIQSAAATAANQVQAIVGSSSEVIWEFINEPNTPSADGRNDIVEYAFWLKQFWTGIKSAQPTHKVISGGASVGPVTNLPGWNTTTKTSATPGSNLANVPYTGGARTHGPVDWYFDLTNASVVGAGFTVHDYGGGDRIDGMGFHSYMGGSAKGPWSLEGSISAGANLTTGSPQNTGTSDPYVLFYNSWRQLNRLELKLTALSVPSTFGIYVTESAAGTHRSWVSGQTYNTNDVRWASQGSSASGGLLWTRPGIYRATTNGVTIQPPGTGWATYSGSPSVNGGESFGTENEAGQNLYNTARLLAGLVADVDARTLTRVRLWCLFRVNDDISGTNWEYGVVYGNGAEKGTGTNGPLDRLVAASGLADPRSATVPSKITGITPVPGPGKVDIVWTFGSNGGSTISDTRIDLNPITNGPYHTNNSGPGITITGLTNGVVYTGRATPINAIGQGPQSDPFTFVPPGPLIGPNDEFTSNFATLPSFYWSQLTGAVDHESVPTESIVSSRLRVTDDTTSGTVRSAMWPVGLSLLADREVRSIMYGPVTDGTQRQQGHIHRLVNPDNADEVAVTITRGIFVTADYNFNVHLMGMLMDTGGGGGGALQIGGWNFGSTGDPGVIGSTPYTTSIYQVVPVNVKTRMVGNVLDVAVWLNSEGEPNYGDPAPARTGTLTITDPRLPTEGYDGLYVGHVNTGTYVEYDNLSIRRVAVASVPAKITTIAVDPRDKAATLVWNAPSDGGSAITGYVVTYHALPSGSPVTVSPPDASPGIVLNGLVNDVTYSVTIHAVNAIGDSPESDALTFTPFKVEPPGKGPTPLSLPTADQLLALGPSNGTRSDGFSFQLLGQDLELIGTLDVDADRAPSVTWDVGRNASLRTCDGLEIPRGDLYDIDPLTDHLRVVAIIGVPGTVSYEFPLGVFRFGDNVRALHSWGTTYTPTLFDRGWLLDQPTNRTYHGNRDGSVQGVIATVVEGIGIDSATIDMGAGDETFGENTHWRAGTSRYAILKDLALLLGCYPPYFTNTGVLRFKPVIDAIPIDHEYGRGNRVVADTHLETDDSFQTPNKWLAIGSGSKSEIVGTYNVPASAPYSFAQRGVVVAKTVDAPGLKFQRQADRAARAAALRDARRIYLSASFSSTLDPRHDGFETFALDGLPFLEQSWRVTCRAGEPMTHQGVRLWSDDQSAVLVQAGGTPIPTFTASGLYGDDLYGTTYGDDPGGTYET